MITRRLMLGGAFGAASSLRVFPAQSAAPPPRGTEEHVAFVEGHPDRPSRWDVSYNLRTNRRARWRALCKTATGISIALNWALEAGIGFAIRSGGHCFEGFSQHDDLVIDVRAVNSLRLDDDARRVTIGPGASVGDVTASLARHGLALPMGYCPSVGLGGHALGGGMGYLVRRHGLLSDRMTGADVIMGDGRTLKAGPSDEPDLLWALRGGGGGSFGIVSAFEFSPVRIGRVLRFNVRWLLEPALAKSLIGTWADVTMSAAHDISSTTYIRGYPGQRISVDLVGISTGEADGLSRYLAHFERVAPAYVLADVRAESWADASIALAANSGQPSTHIKYKSAMIAPDRGGAASGAIVDGLLANPPAFLATSLQALGGHMHEIAGDATAFAHRAGTGFCLQASTGRASRSSVLPPLTGSWMRSARLRPELPTQTIPIAISMRIPTSIGGQTRLVLRTSRRDTIREISFGTRKAFDPAPEPRVRSLVQAMQLPRPIRTVRAHR